MGDLKAVSSDSGNAIATNLANSPFWRLWSTFLKPTKLFSLYYNNLCTQVAKNDTSRRPYWYCSKAVHVNPSSKFYLYINNCCLTWVQGHEGPHVGRDRPPKMKTRKTFFSRRLDLHWQQGHQFSNEDVRKCLNLVFLSPNLSGELKPVFPLIG